VVYLSAAPPAALFFACYKVRLAVVTQLAGAGFDVFILSLGNEFCIIRGLSL
jgi:hypothetical protein